MSGQDNNETTSGVHSSEAVIDNGSFGSRTLRFETGRLARQAAGSATVTLDDETMLISATTADMFTLTIGLASSQANYAQTNGMGYLMAQAVFASLPILMVYIVFQKQIVRAMAGTSLK